MEPPADGPPPSPEAVDLSEPPPPARPRYRRFIAGTVAGAVAISTLAALIALQFAKPDIPAEALARPTSSVARPPDPVEQLDFVAKSWTGEPGTWKVTLTWTASEADGFIVRRDGNVVARPTVARFVDREVTPETHYSYEVIAVAAKLPSKPATVRVETPRLPLAAARVQGRWVLRMDVISSSIGASGGTFVVHLDPACDTGACDLMWRFRQGNAGEAQVDGPSYSGTGSGPFFTVDCHGGAVSSTSVTLEFHVVAAHTLGGQWRASEIEGTTVESVPSVNNCMSAHNEWSFQGSAQG